MLAAPSQGQMTGLGNQTKTLSPSGRHRADLVRLRAFLYIKTLRSTEYALLYRDEVSDHSSCLRI